jgi:superfamily I DNA/RNA helicase
MTYHSAKGLQFEAVFIPIVEKYPVADTELDRKALYVAMTRTYRYLYVLYSGSLPSPLKEVDVKLFATTEKDEVEDI